MSKVHVYVEFPEMDIGDTWLDRVNGLVCVDGSELCFHGSKMMLHYPDNRRDLTPQEASIFITNFFNEDFDEKVTIVSAE